MTFLLLCACVTVVLGLTTTPSGSSCKPPSLFTDFNHHHHHQQNRQRSYGALTHIAVAGTSLVLATSGRSLQVYDLYSGSLRLLIRPDEVTSSNAGPSGGSALGSFLPAPPTSSGVTGGGTGWVTSLSPVELDESAGRWAVLVGAAGGLVACHCVETGRLLFQLRSSSTAAIVALQLQPPQPPGGLRDSLLFGLDAASQLHAWKLPDDAFPPLARQQQRGRTGAGALLGSCRLGATGLGVPTSLVLPQRGSTCLFAAGWGGTLCVVRAARRDGEDGRAAQVQMTSAVAGSLSGLQQGRRAASGGQQQQQVGGRSSPVSAPETQPRVQPAVAAAGRDGAKPPAVATPAAAAAASESNQGGSQGSQRVAEAGATAGSQFGVLSMGMLEGGRLLVGLADGSIKVVQFGNPLELPV